MFDRSQSGARRVTMTMALTVAAALLAPAPSAAPNAWRFAAEMAERGNWREARYRWEQALRDAPDEPKILNNLAVACESLGDVPRALELYRQAVAAAPGDPDIQDNLRRSSLFWRRTGAGPDGDASPATPTTRSRRGEGRRVPGKSVKVQVSLPVPPRLKLEGSESLLVTSFLAEENNLLDTNRELVRFLRSEFRKQTGLAVLDINPPPAIPEQTIDDLLANHEFWRHLGRNYDADIIVSGVIKYDREDASTFQDVDIVSSRTGQKVRQSRFVEQEQFAYVLQIFFIDGVTGKLRFRDRLQRNVIFQGQQNDPITAFYALSESIADDVLSVVTQRSRNDTRIIFKK